MCNVGLYNVVVVNIKEVKWSKLSGFRYVCVCACTCFVVDCLFNGENNVAGEGGVMPITPL